MAKRTKLPVKKLRELEKVVVEFVDKYHVTAESVGQNDEIIINAYDLISELCVIVGEYEYPDDEFDSVD